MASASLARAPIQCPGRLNQTQVMTLVEGGVGESRLVQILDKCSVGFHLTEEFENQLRRAGATANVINAIRRNEPPRESEEALKLKAELMLWESVRDSKQIDLVHEYLGRYPNGQFKSVARLRVGELMPKRDRPAIESAIQAKRWAEAEGLIAAVAEYVPDHAQIATWRKGIQAGREAEAKEAALRRAAEEEAERARANLKRAGYVRIEPGTFLMGCSPGDGGCDDDEKPAHRVRITTGFETGKFEVTQAEWEAVMGSNPSRFKGADRPVENVSWEGVQQFLSRLKARGHGYRYRLPTEAEWEYAARAGTTGKYYGELDEIAWYEGNSGGQTHPVGQKKPNTWGLYDMLGNVWEWCSNRYNSDYYREFRKTIAVDPQGPERGRYRVLRGGSRDYGPRVLRVSERYGVVPSDRDDEIGFRCVRER